MRIREYTLPAAGARPRRIALAPDGMVYYTDFARGYLGHFDPSTGRLLKEWLSPGGSDSEPYGIAITNDGEIWCSESGVKPKYSGEVRSQIGELPYEADPLSRGCGQAIWWQLPIGQLYLACSGVNQVAVVSLNR
jgi:virginiamycin B lyase